MLSLSNTVNDILKLIINNYQEYGFSSADAFQAGIISCIDESKLLYMIPAIGESYYDQIAAKDKVDLTIVEQNIYYGEVFFSTGTFLRRVSMKEYQRRSGETVSKSESGKSRSASGPPGKLIGGEEMFSKAYTFMNLAGYNFSMSFNTVGIQGNWESIDKGFGHGFNPTT